LIEFIAYAMRNPDLYPDFLARHRAGRAAVAKMIEEHAPEGGAEAWADPNQKALILEAVGNGIALEKLIDPEGVPDDLFAQLLPVLIEAFDAGKL
jgi:hypothetical protein